MRPALAGSPPTLQPSPRAPTVPACEPLGASTGGAQTDWFPIAGRQFDPDGQAAAASQTVVQNCRRKFGSMTQSPVAQSLGARQGSPY